MLQGPNPTTSTGLEFQYRSWSWHIKRAGREEAQKAFSLTDASELQNDTSRVFYSGVAFGVAGAAFIALAEQLLKPPEPSGDDDVTPEPDTPEPGKVEVEGEPDDGGFLDEDRERQEVGNP
jgi:hypothetical protein